MKLINAEHCTSPGPHFSAYGRRIGTACLGLLTSAIFPLSALRAETTPAEETTPPPEEKPLSIEETPPPLELAPYTVFTSQADRPEIMDTGFALDSAEIQNRNRPGLWEVIQDLPGIYVVNPGALGANYELTLRGGDPNFTKVLIDGIEVNNLMDSRGGSYNLNALSSLATERIELLPGSRSAIYGSEALSGVLLFETMPTPDAPSPSTAVLEGEIGGGEYSRIGGSIFGFPLAQSDLSGKLSFENASEDGVYEDTRFRVNRGTAGLALPLEGGGLVRVNFFGAEIDRQYFPDDSGGPEYAVLRETEHRKSREAGVSTRAEFELTDTLDLSARAFYYKIHDEVDSPGVAPGVRDPFGLPASSEDTDFDRWGIDGHLGYSPNEMLSFVFGASLKNEKGTSESVLFFPFGPVPGDYEKTLRTRSLYGEGVWEVVPGQYLSLALRYDDIEGQKNQTSERASYTVELPVIYSNVRLAYGTGYKTPSFYALANPIVGNPDLEDEESKLYEFTISTRPANGPFLISNTLFIQDFTNLIDFSPGPPPQLVNRDDVTTQGFTTELSWEARSDLLLSGNVTYAHLDLPSGSPPIRNRPEWQAAAILTWTPIDSLEITPQGRYISSREDSSIPTGPQKLGSYFLFDLALAWKPNDTFRVTLAIDNLLNRHVERTIGYVDPGIRARFGINASF